MTMIATWQERAKEDDWKFSNEVYHELEIEDLRAALAAAKEKETKLREVIALYDEALKTELPQGAEGAVFDYWNGARKLMGVIE